MAGILAAIRLREEGCDDLVVYEKADGLGGTWRENTYPGLSCDVPSHFYTRSGTAGTRSGERKSRLGCSAPTPPFDAGLSTGHCDLP